MLKAGHLVEVMGSHCHLPINNVKGVICVLPPLNQCLYQDVAGGTFQKQAKNRLEASYTY